MRPETGTASAPPRTAGSPARIPLFLWPAVFLGLAAAVGSGYVGARWTAESLREELALRPPVILFDMAGAVRDAEPAQLGAEVARQKEQAERLAAGGFLVLDAQAVIAAPPELYLVPDVNPEGAGDPAR
jgi:hypothetical protein